MSVNSKMKAIADKLRYHCLTGKKYSLDDMAVGVDEVYEIGETHGWVNGYDDGEEVGYQSAQEEMGGYSLNLSEALTSGDMNAEPLSTNINQAIRDIGAIKTLIENHGVEVPVGTLSSTYDETIEQVITDEKAQSLAQGKQAVVDEFWDSYQQNGNRTNYANAFEGALWTDDTFKPQYDMSVVLNANYMFQNCKITDLSKINIVESQGAYALCFGVTSLVTFGSIDVSYYNVNNGGNFGQAFYDCKNLVSIGTLTVGAKTSFSYTFYNCNNLTDVTFNGKIGQSLDISKCPLNRKSIDSILECLSTTSTGTTLTLKTGLVDTAFETSEGAADGRQVFESLIADKTNWKFSY